MTHAERLSSQIPSSAYIHAIARETLARLGSPFRQSLGDIVLVVEEYADAPTIQSLGLNHPMQLSGLYQGVPLSQRSISQSGTMPERVTLYRQPILVEWRSTPHSLDAIISHIVIHEIGHHFGFSDADMQALEREAE